MLRFSRTKIILTAGVIVLGLLLAVPSMMTREQRDGLMAGKPSWVPSWLLPTRAIVLGLDLQGGSHILLEVDSADLTRTQGLALRDDVRRLLRETGVAAEGGIQLTGRGVQFRVPDAAARARLMPKVRELSQPITNAVLGQTGARTLDMVEQPDGLVQLVLSEQGLADRVRRATEQSIEVIRRRIDERGTREPSIQRQGADRILVQVPGLQDPSQLESDLGRTAKLEFRMLGDAGSTDTEQLPSRDSGGQRVPVERRVIVDGGDLTDAQPAFDSRTNEPIVNFRFNLRGAQRFGEATTQNVGRPLAIVLDNEVISSPRILQPITGGRARSPAASTSSR
jgi:preprotein translocase subunit SecD